MSFDWFAWYPLKFRKKTLRLSLAADGAYRRLIDEYMMQRGPLPDDDGALARILGVPLDMWLEVSLVVRPYFHKNGDRLAHGMCEEQLRVQERKGHERSKISKNAATARWAEHNRLKQLDASRMRQAHASSNADAMHGDATLQSKNITSSEYDAAREAPSTASPSAEAPKGIQGRRTTEQSLADLRTRQGTRRSYG
jgi:uncharacterized protein YdaU (DUF1376 family)